MHHDIQSKLLAYSFIQGITFSPPLDAHSRLVLFPCLTNTWYLQDKAGSTMGIKRRLSPFFCLLITSQHRQQKPTYAPFNISNKNTNPSFPQHPPTTLNKKQSPTKQSKEPSSASIHCNYLVLAFADLIHPQHLPASIQDHVGKGSIRLSNNCRDAP